MSRLEKLGAVIQKEVSHILRKTINDSRIGFVSITHVKVSTDLAKAWVYYSCIGTETSLKETRKGLNAAKKFIDEFEIG